MGIEVDTFKEEQKEEKIIFYFYLTNFSSIKIEFKKK